MDGRIRLTDVADTVERVLDDDELGADFGKSFDEPEGILALDRRVRDRTDVYLRDLND